MSGPKYTPADYEKVMAMPAERYSLRDVERATGVSMSTVKRMRHGQWEPPEPSMPLLGRSPLTGVIEEHMDQGWSLDDLTVLARDNDPFRQDRSEGHKLGHWLRDTLEAMGLQVGEGGRVVHNRGLHYLLIGQARPDGRVYENDEKTWKWLSDRVSKAARWLGYVPFGQIIDQRNDEPVIRIKPLAAEEKILLAEDASGLIPDAEYFVPEAHLEGDAIQPFRLAIFGEKSSLDFVLGPIAEEYGADLVLPTGEVSDTILHQMASLALAEDRPLIIVYFSDADPSGWQMPISVSRKLQAFSELLGPFGFEVHRAALTPDQVRAWGLPSTPLKPTELRAAAWEQAMGTRQTEVDAAIALRPAELAQAARDALGPFFDHTLAGRFSQARQEWEEQAQEVIDDGLDGDRDELLAAAEGTIGQARELVRQVRDSLQTSATLADLDGFEPPEPDCPAGTALPSDLGTALISSADSFPDQCRKLRDSKKYGGGEDEGGDGEP